METVSKRGSTIYRTKDRVRDWRGDPLFPSREIRSPIVVELGKNYVQWYLAIAALYDSASSGGARSRAAGWAKGQALQWAASSVQAGLGYLVRLSMRRLQWSLEHEEFAGALAILRPYRGGHDNEPLPALYERLCRQIGATAPDQFEVDDDDADADEDEQWMPDPNELAKLLKDGIKLIKSGAAQAKWDAVCQLIDDADDEKIVLFAQPVETVTIIAEILEARYGQRPAIIIPLCQDRCRVT